MKVGFIDPGTKKLSLMPHVGLGYVAAVLEQDGHDVSILDTGVATKPEADRFFGTAFDALGVTATSFTYREATEVIRAYKTAHPRVPVVLGGPHVTIAAEEVFQCGDIDFAVRGEGEQTMKELAGLLGQGLPSGHEAYGDILGLMYRDHDTIQVNRPRPRNRALDELPFPDYPTLPMERYEVYPLLTSRGCPYRCTFCAAHVLCGGLWRGRSPENLVDEVQHQRSIWGDRRVVVCDDNFNLRVDRAKKFCTLLLDNNIHMDWVCWSFRADRADPDLLEVMRESGCNSIAVGVESANPTVLKNIRKNETIDKIEAGIKNIKESGILCQTLNMIGNQGDNLDTVRETIAFSRRLMVDAAFYMAIPYPKTELWDYVVKSGRFLKPDYTQFHHFGNEPIFETDDFTREQRIKAYRIAHRFELAMKLRLTIHRKLTRLRRRGLRGVGLRQVKSTILDLSHLALDYLVSRRRKV